MALENKPHLNQRLILNQTNQRTPMPGLGLESVFIGPSNGASLSSLQGPTASRLSPCHLGSALEKTPGAFGLGFRTPPNSQGAVHVMTNCFFVSQQASQHVCCYIIDVVPLLFSNQHSGSNSRILRRLNNQIDGEPGQKVEEEVGHAVPQRHPSALHIKRT